MKLIPALLKEILSKQNENIKWQIVGKMEKILRNSTG